MRRKPPSVELVIQRLVRRLARLFDPDRIILFGSHARGDARPDSDIDLLVVMHLMSSAGRQLLGAQGRKRLNQRRPCAPARQSLPDRHRLFYAQQCVEKYLKALLVWRGTDFHKTHCVPTLVAQMVQRDRPDLSDAEQALLMRYAAVTRYSGDHDSFTFAEARQAVKIARRVQRQIRKLLPR